MRYAGRTTLAALILALSLSGAAAAVMSDELSANHLDANVAYERGDYTTALSLYRPLAEGGNADAQASLCIMYAVGQGVPQDYDPAVMWCHKAADQGDASSQYNLGLMYYEGQGVPQDHWEAAKWYGMAADQGVTSAQNNLGGMYLNGRGVPQDYVLAHKWYNLAAASTPASETESRNRAVKNRDLVASKMTPAQIAEAQKLAREWKRKLGK